MKSFIVVIESKVTRMELYAAERRREPVRFLLMLPTPFDDLPNTAVIFSCIFLIHFGSFHVGRRIWIRVREQGLNRGQDRRNAERRRPTLVQNVKANFAVEIDVGMKDGCGKLHQWRLVGIFFRERHGQSKNASLPRSILRSSDDTYPLTQIAFVGCSAHALGRLRLQRHKIAHQFSSRRRCHDCDAYKRASLHSCLPDAETNLRAVPLPSCQSALILPAELTWILRIR